MTNFNKPPGLLRRLAAMTYDLLLVTAVLALATAILLPFKEGEVFEPNSLLYSIYLLLVSFLFYGWFWITNGQTLGLMAWKLTIKDENMSPLSWKQAFFRFITAIFSWGILGFGILWPLFNKERLMWHDITSKSRVYWVKPD
jgi:uncharacterized RDD family membrane protein YckC